MALYKIERRGEYAIELIYDETPENPRTEWDNAGTMVCFHGRYKLGDDKKDHGFSDPEDLALFLGLDPPGPTPRRPELSVLNDNEFAPDEFRTLHQLANHPYAHCFFIDKTDPYLRALAVKDSPELRLDFRRKLAMALYRWNRDVWQQKVEDRRSAGYPRFEGVYLSLYLYDHSGITMSTGSFNDPWDSGQVGYIYITKEDILKEWGKPGQKILTKALRERATTYLEGEVETYDAYLRGNVYCQATYYLGGIDADELAYFKDDEEIKEQFPDAVEIDSCSGYYDEEQAIADGMAAIEHDQETRPAIVAEQQRRLRLKAWTEEHKSQLRIPLTNPDGTNYALWVQ